MAAGRAPQASIAARTPGCLCAGRLSMTTMSPGLSVGTSMASTQARKAGPSMAPSMVIGASIPETRSPPTNVVVFPVPVRHCGDAPRAATRASAAARHLGRGAGLVDEHEAAGVEVSLRGAPGLPAGDHVGAIPLAGVHRFF